MNHPQYRFFLPYPPKSKNLEMCYTVPEALYDTLVAICLDSVLLAKKEDTKPPTLPISGSDANTVKESNFFLAKISIFNISILVLHQTNAIMMFNFFSLISYNMKTQILLKSRHNVSGRHIRF